MTSPLAEPLRPRVLAIASQVFGVQANRIDPHASWQELSVDSLDLVEFFLALQEQLQVELDPADLSGVQTLNGLIEQLESRSAA